ncbi:PDZ and LIM domain protein 7 isoform X1 [Molothrus ater]|uniref:PDZ and LIM domain protein 7 isoform X1 n=2 Tax=Molothrus ater TaxID=84834 RepID=UPI0023E84FD1|nr:PDZ and LIM domain protein 7 isoform X1 [Molothrus ater]
MGDMESYKVMLNGPAPWGFRLQGGKDFSMPLSISRLTLGGKAAQAGVGVGDWVLYIDGESTSAMTHIEAQNRIRACGDRLCLTLSRAQNQLGKPQKVLSLDKQPPQLLEPPSTPVCDPVKLRMLEDIDDSKPPSWTSQSRSFRKLSRLVGADAMEDGEDELVKKPRDAHGSSWGTEEQWQPLEPPSTPGCDPGKLRMLEDAEDWQPRTGTSQSRSFRKLAQLTGTDGMEDGEDEFIKKPRDAHGSNWGTGQHRQPPQALEPPSDTVCDPVKLRMLEDIVDSKPHTWTSQSRSFRKLARLVGANSMDDGEDEPVKKPRDSHGSIWGIVEQREPLEPPSTPGCDPGKLRLMEDAEGWQPRTGTSQSRSFRRLAQLTGTDEMEDGEDQIVKKPRDAHGSSWGTVEQRQPPQPLEPPSTPGCSPGKLRLMEDAEDWQPRTGTSQSRTFRRLAQLTGTDSSSEFPQGLALPGRAGLSLGCQSLAESGVALECWFWPRVVPVGWLSQGSWWGCAWSRAGDTGLGFWSALWLGRALFWGRVWWEERLVFLFSPLSPLVVPGPLSVRTDCFLLSLLLRSVEDHDDVFVRKPSQVSVPDPSPGAAMKTEPGLAPRTPSATPSPTSRPPWAVDPSFAERYAPDKTSTVVSKHSQPATPTPMQNRSSIVQAAQQAPEGPGRTPLCYKCNKVIRGRYLVALGHYYHPEEFICCQCRKVLDEGGFFEEKGSIFCPKCYDTRYAPTCAKCKKKITGEVMHALKMTWHVQCFTCNACKTPIRNRAFYMEEGQPYCERDYEKMFGTKCRGCDFKIDAGDRFLEALGFSWHDTCFVCAICQTNLEGKTFYSKKDKPLCKSHAFSHV